MHWLFVDGSVQKAKYGLLPLNRNVHENISQRFRRYNHDNDSARSKRAGWEIPPAPAQYKSITGFRFIEFRPLTKSSVDRLPYDS